MAPRGTSTAVMALCMMLGLAQLGAQASSDLYTIQVPETDLLGQMHGDPISADLRLFMAGNQVLITYIFVMVIERLDPSG